MKNHNLKKYVSGTALLFVLIVGFGSTPKLAYANHTLGHAFTNIVNEVLGTSFTDSRDMVDGGGPGGSGDSFCMSSCPDNDDDNDGGIRLTAAQVAAITAANTITNAEALAMTAADFNALTGVARVSAEMARARATGREITYNSDGSISVEVCDNGRGGEWILPDPASSVREPVPEPEDPDDSCRDRGTCPSIITSCTRGVNCTCAERNDCPITTCTPGVNCPVATCTPGVNCTCTERNDCVITAELEALVADFTVDLRGQPDIRTYSSRSRDIFPSTPIWLRWRGYDQNGAPADRCYGVEPDDFTAPLHLPLGRFVDASGRPADGGSRGVAGAPYPGLNDGETETYRVRCEKAGAIPGIASVTLSARSCTLDCGAVPTIIVNDSEGPVIVRFGEEVNISWNPFGNTTCTLSPQIALGNNANAIDEDTYTMTGESTFSITCEGGTDSVSVRVLPREQET